MRAAQTSPAHHERGGILINFVIDKLKWGAKAAEIGWRRHFIHVRAEWRVWTRGDCFGRAFFKF